MFVFFTVHLVYTQKIYSNNRFTSFFIFSVLFPLILICFNLDQNKENLLKLISLGCIFPIHYLLLIILKKNYGQINKFLVRKNWVDKEYCNKDFTFVYWDGDGVVPDYWDEKLAVKPSWLDHLFTLLLLALPLLSIQLIFVTITALFV
jgi:hypothetical protein